MTRTSDIQWDDDYVHFILDQHAKFDFHSASALEQQFVGRHVAPFGHIIMISGQRLFVLAP